MSDLNGSRLPQPMHAADRLGRNCGVPVIQWNSSSIFWGGSCCWCCCWGKSSKMVLRNKYLGSPESRMLSRPAWAMAAGLFRFPWKFSGGVDNTCWSSDVALCIVDFIFLWLVCVLIDWLCKCWIFGSETSTFLFKNSKRNESNQSLRRGIHLSLSGGIATFNLGSSAAAKWNGSSQSIALFCGLCLSCCWSCRSSSFGASAQWRLFL